MTPVVLAILLGVLGPEESYGPYARSIADGQPAFAVSRNGILMAWGEQIAIRGRIHVGLLDFNARLVSPIAIIPSGETDHALTVTAATDGTSFLVVYTAISNYTLRVYAQVVDSTGRLAGASRELHVSDLTKPLKVIWNGTQYIVWSGETAFAIDRDGTVAASGPFTTPAAIAAVNGVVTTADWRITRTCVGWYGFWCVRFHETHELTWTSPNSSGSALVDPPIGPIALGTNGAQSLAAWSDGYGIIVMELDDKQPNKWGVIPPAGAAHGLSVACDALECLVVSSTTVSEIYGFVFDLRQRRPSGVFAITTSPRGERFPQVHALGNGHFLVAYLSDAAGDFRIAGRIVTTRTSKQRVVR